MTELVLWGTLTSPFVRRIRIVAQELGIPFPLVDAFTDAGQADLRAHSPVWKVPAARIDGRVIWDSHAIVDYILETRGAGPLRLPAGDSRWDEVNLMNAVDEALGAGIRLFYLKRDGVDVDNVAYLKKERERIASILHWVDAQVKGGFCTTDHRFGLGEIITITAIDWMQFRKMVDVSPYPHLLALLALHGDRPSLVATRPS